MARILIVDDEPDLRALLATVLAGTGYEVLEAENGQKALEACASGAPDLVILDEHLPDTDGFEVCRRIRSLPRNPRVPVLMCSIRSAAMAEEQAQGGGPDGYLRKPFEISEFLARVESVLGPR